MNRQTVNNLIVSMRPLDWAKNSFVLAPLFFSGNLRRLSHIVPALTTCVAFCLAASAVYILNDIFDRENDRCHPLKRHRPIPAGQLPIPMALLFACVLIAVALVLATTVNPPTLGLVVLYMLSCLMYSLMFKQIIFLDVISLSFGFVLRAVAGATAIKVLVSPWLIGCTFCLAVFLTLCKRLYELKHLGREAPLHRTVLAAYTPMSLVIGIYSAAFFALGGYSAYTFFPLYTPQTLHTERLPLTIPFVLLGLLRYGWMAYKGNKTGRPAEALLTDWRLLSIVAGWIATLLILV